VRSDTSIGVLHAFQGSCARFLVLSRHCTDLEVQRNYVDSHGQSHVAFACAYLLGFELMPRLKDIAAQKLHRPESGRPADYPNLQPILAQPIDWGTIRPQYKECRRARDTFWDSMSQNDCARRQPFCAPVRPAWGCKPKPQKIPPAPKMANLNGQIANG
jgi:hypothetical protein